MASINEEVSGGDDSRPLCRCGCNRPLPPRRRSYFSDQCQRDATRAKRLLEQFSITPAEYDALLEFQGGGCAICHRPPKQNKRLAVDHDHRSGQVRGLLCFLDNKRILGARSTETILALAEYVTNPPGVAVLGERVAAGRPRRKKRKSRRVRR